MTIRTDQLTCSYCGKIETVMWIPLDPNYVGDGMRLCSPECIRGQQQFDRIMQDVPASPKKTIIQMLRDVFKPEK